jgi:hypothetical protein
MTRAGPVPCGATQRLLRGLVLSSHLTASQATSVSTHVPPPDSADLSVQLVCPFGRSPEAPHTGLVAGRQHLHCACLAGAGRQSKKPPPFLQIKLSAFAFDKHCSELVACVRVAGGCSPRVPPSSAIEVWRNCSRVSRAQVAPRDGVLCAIGPALRLFQVVCAASTHLEDSHSSAAELPLVSAPDVPPVVARYRAEFKCRCDSRRLMC